MKVIKAEHTYEVWKNALQHILNQGQEYNDHQDRICRECLNILFKIEKPSEGVRKPIDRLNKFERWIYPSIEEIKKYILSKETSMGYEYSYGERIFSYSQDGQTKDQINDFVIPLLEKNQSSRRAVVTIWNPLEDSNIFKKEIPGMMMIDFKVRDDSLHTTEIIRSNDVFYGWPANIYQCFKIHELIADKLDLEAGTLSTVSTSAHIFEDQIKYIKQILQE